MSGHSYETTCPNCDSNVNAYSDYKPFDYVSIGPCLECGFEAYTKSTFNTLKNLNELRAQANEDRGFDKNSEDYLHPLKKRPARKDYL